MSAQPNRLAIPFIALAVPICALVGLTPPTQAQVCVSPDGGPIVGFNAACPPGPPINCDETPGGPGPNCENDKWCYKPTVYLESITILGGCDPTQPGASCSVRANIASFFRWNHLNPFPPPGSRGWITLDWRDSQGGFAGECGQPSGAILWESGTATIQIGGYSCGVEPDLADVYTLTAKACDSSSCNIEQSTLDVDLTLPRLDALFCQEHEPPQDEPRCETSPDTGSGASVGGGGPTGVPLPDSGPVWDWKYTAGGSGDPSTPGGSSGPTGWPQNLSAPVTRRIVEAPDETHVWLVTAGGSFAEFSQLVGGVYEVASPSDEHRTLSVLDDGQGGVAGWELRELDGTTHVFDDAGLWSETVSRNDSHTAGQYSGTELDLVTLPDGRAVDYEYHPTGRLLRATEVGVADPGPPATREWVYSWAGDLLVRVLRPDGTALELFYQDERHPGFITRLESVGVDPPGSAPPRRQVLQGWSYDDEGNVVETWRGDTSQVNGTDAPGEDAVELYAFAYDDPALPTVTTVTNALGSTTTYALERDTVSLKPRVAHIEGNCPICGFGPETEFQYDDEGDNPLLPVTTIEHKGTVGNPILVTTNLDYDENGQVTLRTEAVGTSVERFTSWDYDLNYESFPTLVQTESALDELDFRETEMSYDAGTGDLDWREIRGLERIAGVDTSFMYRTNFLYNTAGRVTLQDPPGYATDDVTQWTYDEVDRGGLVPTSRTDPLVGTTAFVHDDFNRLVRTVDPNGLRTDTQYDDLDRVVRVIQRATPGSPTDPPAPGDPPAAGDLATTHTYNNFGDLFRTTLPEGNVIEYLYDYDLESPPPVTTLGVGRLRIVERKPNASTAGERTIYLYDDMGNRTHEEQQEAGTAVRSATDYTYRTGGCLVEKVIRAPGLAEESVTEYDYDCAGNLIGVWDANHPKATNPTAPLRYEYDELDRLARVRQASGSGAPAATACDGTSTTDHVTCYGYDVQDHLIQVEDAERNVTDYLYSDRDLLTEQSSQAAGDTALAYNEHGELISETDGRDIEVTRVVDAADRVTFSNYPDDALDTTYAYDSSTTCTAPHYPVGRLASISRTATTVDYCYDLFGRVTQDGDLSYTYDDNGNRKTITYPGEVTATYGYDASDRAASLSVPGQTIVSSAAYEPSGPLASLTLGNGLVETRDFDQRYFPSGIELADAMSLLEWSYTVDAVGNVLAIDDLVSPDPADDRTFGYQDHQYLLTCAAGPWVEEGATCDPPSTEPVPFEWTYDRIGNRLSEQREAPPEELPGFVPSGTEEDMYLYVANTSGGNSPLLSEINFQLGGSRLYTFGAAGHLEEVESGASVVSLTIDAAGRIGRFQRSMASGGSALATADVVYDGRGFLREVTSVQTMIFQDGFETGDTSCWTSTVGDAGESPGGACPPPPPEGPAVEALYDSQGTLQAITRTPSGGSPVTELVFYFAGRPIAQRTDDGTTVAWQLFTTDHLGAPIAGTDETGALLWDGGLEPFGAAVQTGTFLRLPGQWSDLAWQDAASGLNPFYNVNRWYESGTGSYTRADPFPLMADPSSAILDTRYVYANARPTFLVDRLGLAVEVCSRPADVPVAKQLGIPHRWLRTGTREGGLGPLGGDVPGFEQGAPPEGNDPSVPPSPEQMCNSCPYLSKTQIRDHSGQGDQPGSTCRVVKNVDEGCVNMMLSIGRPMGRWSFLTNDCWAFVNYVMAQCSTGRPASPGIPMIVP